MLLTEFHIPISPTPDFLCRVHYLAASIARNSGLRPAQYRIVVTVGDSTPADLSAMCAWTDDFPLEWRWVSTGMFNRWSYVATAYGRYCYDYASETVVMLDGDVLVTGSLVEMIEAVRGTDQLAAVPGYFSPFYLHRDHLKQGSPMEWWQRICSLAGVRLLPFTTEHPGWTWMRKSKPRYVDQLQFSPPYPNAGVVIASAGTARRIGRDIFSDLELVNGVSKTNLSGQIALSLAISRLGLEWVPLPLRYNFQNLPMVYDAYSAEASDIRVLHFLNETEISRVRDFASYEHVAQLFNRYGLHKVNRYLVENLRKVHERVTGNKPL